MRKSYQRELRNIFEGVLCFKNVNFTGEAEEANGGLGGRLQLWRHLVVLSRAPLRSGRWSGTPTSAAAGEGGKEGSAGVGGALEVSAPGTVARLPRCPHALAQDWRPPAW